MHITRKKILKVVKYQNLVAKCFNILSIIALGAEIVTIF